MKRSEINATKEKLQKLTEVAMDVIFNLLNSDKNNVYTLNEIIEAVVKDFDQQGLEMGLSSEMVRRAIIRATLNLACEKKIVEDRIGSEDYYGSN